MTVYPAAWSPQLTGEPEHGQVSFRIRDGDGDAIIDIASAESRAIAAALLAAADAADQWDQERASRSDSPLPADEQGLT